MIPRNEEQKLVETQNQTKASKPRFQIEKLEERIAPHSPKIYGPHDHGIDKSGCWRGNRGDRACG